MLCPACDGSGWQCYGVVDLGAGRPDGSVVHDVLVFGYRRCPLRCERGYYVTAVMIGARASAVAERATAA